MPLLRMSLRAPMPTPLRQRAISTARARQAPVQQPIERLGSGAPVAVHTDGTPIMPPLHSLGHAMSTNEQQRTTVPSRRERRGAKKQQRIMTRETRKRNTIAALSLIHI